MYYGRVCFRTDGSVWVSLITLPAMSGLSSHHSSAGSKVLHMNTVIIIINIIIIIKRELMEQIN